MFPNLATLLINWGMRQLSQESNPNLDRMAIFAAGEINFPNKYKRVDAFFSQYHHISDSTGPILLRKAPYALKYVNLSDHVVYP